MVLMKYFFFFASVAMVTDIVYFFPISIGTTVREANSFNTLPIPQCLGLPNLVG